MLQISSSDKFFQEIYQSYKNHKHRSPVEDFKTLLKLKKINYKVYFRTKNIAKIPAIIAANHFVHPLLARKSPFTTTESMITSAIITQAASVFLGEKITWVVKNDLRENIFFLSINLRKIQLASIYCHNFIGVAQNYPFGQFRKWAKFLKSGYSIGVYPEGLVSSQMREAKPGFNTLLDYLKSRKVIFQILPVSIYYKSSSYVADVGYPVKPVFAGTRIARTTMLSVASNLPIYLQGAYRQKVGDFKTQTPLQPAGDRKLKLPEPQVLAV